MSLRQTVMCPVHKCSACARLSEKWSNRQGRINHEFQLLQISMVIGGKVALQFSIDHIITANYGEFKMKPFVISLFFSSSDSRCWSMIQTTIGLLAVGIAAALDYYDYVQNIREANIHLILLDWYVSAWSMEVIRVFHGIWTFNWAHFLFQSIFLNSGMSSELLRTYNLVDYAQECLSDFFFHLVLRKVKVALIHNAHSIVSWSGQRKTFASPNKQCVDKCVLWFFFHNGGASNVHNWLTAH